jgi:GNAT superfamily N-acetyltransferase
MSLTYAVEAWSDVWPELEVLLQDHWQEIALDKDVIALDMDLARYGALEAQGMLHVVTARHQRVLCGYHVSIVTTHLHYRTSLTAAEDLYYLTPPYRHGWAGVRLFQYVEATLRPRGVERMAASCKLHFQQGRVARLFARLGWTQTEALFTKYIGTKRG